MPVMGLSAEAAAKKQKKKEEKERKKQEKEKKEVAKKQKKGVKRQKKVLSFHSVFYNSRCSATFSGGEKGG